MHNTVHNPSTISARLTYDRHTIHYLKIGTGNQALIALHGYGDKAKLFEPLVDSLGEAYTIYALDLPYHGATRWNTEQLYTLADMVGIIEHLRQKEGIERFSLMGYSMGGKITLALIPVFVKQLNEVFLIAGSGIRQSNWFYKLPIGLVHKMKHFVQHPKMYQRFLGVLDRYKLIARPIYNMYKAILDTETRRLKMYNTWLSLFDFKTPVAKIQKLLNKHKVKVNLLYGTRDQAINHTEALYFAKGLKRVNLQLLDADHWLVNEHLNEALSRAIVH